MQKKQLITVKSEALKRLIDISSKKNGSPLKLSVITRGCNGLSYSLDYLDDIYKFDEKIPLEGVDLYVDPKAIMFLFGSQMDYREDDLHSGFVFSNPNSTGSCGCGESFSVDPKLLSDALKSKNQSIRK